MDLSKFGNTYTNELHATTLSNPNGDLSVNAGNKLVLSAFSAIEIGSPETVVVIKGPLKLDGEFIQLNGTSLTTDNDDETGNVKSLEGDSLVIDGSSILRGDLNVDGSIDFNGDLLSSGEIKLNSGGLSIDCNSSLKGRASQGHLVFGDSTEGSWRIGVSEAGRMQFQQNDGHEWVTVNEIGFASATEEVSLRPQYTPVPAVSEEVQNENDSQFNTE
jgi:hypothetical protein